MADGVGKRRPKNDGSRRMFPSEFAARRCLPRLGEPLDAVSY
jgi:hypothetical protein